jgi:hypothetical protein
MHNQSYQQQQPWVYTNGINLQQVNKKHWGPAKAGPSSYITFLKTLLKNIFNNL